MAANKGCEGAQPCFEFHNLSLYSNSDYVFFFCWEPCAAEPHFADRELPGMKRFVLAALAALLLGAFTTTTQAAPCLIVAPKGARQSTTAKRAPERWCGLVITAMIAAP